MDNRGIEPRPSACKTPVLPLTPVAQRPTRESNPAALLCRQRLYPRSRSELLCSDSNRGGRALQARLACPWPTTAEEGGIEPLPCWTSSLSRGGAPHGAHLPEESRGIEPLGVTLARLSRPLAHRWTLPSTASPQGFEPRLPGPEPGDLPLVYRESARLAGIEPTASGFGIRCATIAQTHGSSGIRTQVFRL